MRITLRDGRSVMIRLLQPTDRLLLYNYLDHLSAESRSRFGPHAFDQATIDGIVDRPDRTIQRYVALNETDNEIVGYMLIQQGMIEEDRLRYAARGQFFDLSTTVTFAPSVADGWQSSGLGFAMSEIIEDELRARSTRHIVLWGGVQATNTKAINFYKKLSYRFIASFWYDNKDNHDMLKELQS
jgi:diamine N-acetyltransferase